MTVGDKMVRSSRCRRKTRGRRKREGKSKMQNVFLKKKGKRKGEQVGKKRGKNGVKTKGRQVQKWKIAGEEGNEGNLLPTRRQTIEISYIYKIRCMRVCLSVCLCIVLYARSHRST